MTPIIPQYEIKPGTTGKEAPVRLPEAKPRGYEPGIVKPKEWRD